MEEQALRAVERVELASGLVVQRGHHPGGRCGSGRRDEVDVVIRPARLETTDRRGEERHADATDSTEGHAGVLRCGDDALRFMDRVCDDRHPAVNAKSRSPLRAETRRSSPCSTPSWYWLPGLNPAVAPIR